MFKPSYITCIAVGKLVGLLFGLVGLIVLPIFVPDTSTMLRIGVLLWYTTLGGIIGMSSVFTWHPVLKIPISWWLKSALLGGWMNFLLILFAYDNIRQLMVTAFGDISPFLVSPFWFIPEGVFVGLVIGYFARKAGGEGKEVADSITWGDEG